MPSLLGMTIRLGGTIVAAILLAGCSEMASSGGDTVNDEYTCEDLAEEAAALGESSTGVSLLKVRQPEMVTDNRADYQVPTGSGETLVLECRGAGVFSNNAKSDVKLKATVDADEDYWVSWAPVN